MMAKEKKGLSRRAFLKDGALAIGGVLTGSMLLTGCSKNPNDHLKKPADPAGKEAAVPEWL